MFFAFVLDAYSHKVVGWEPATNMRTTLVLDALRMALWRRGPGADVALVHHSDRGSPCTSIDYTQTLPYNGLIASVGAVGDAYGNGGLQPSEFERLSQTSTLEISLSRTEGTQNPVSAEPGPAHRLHKTGGRCGPPSLASTQVQATVEFLFLHAPGARRCSETPARPLSPAAAWPASPRSARGRC